MSDIEKNHMGSQRRSRSAEEAARVLVDMFLHHAKATGGRQWHLTRPHWTAEHISALELTPAEFDAGLKLLCAMRLIALVATGPMYQLTEHGLREGLRAGRLDELLPLRDGTERSSLPASPEQGRLFDATDLLHTPELAAIVARDQHELFRAVDAGLWKASMLLAGSILEGVLVDVLCKNEAVSGSYMGQRQSFPRDASLGKLVEIAGKERLLGDVATTVALTIIDHRDLIHPHSEVRSQRRIDAATVQGILALVQNVLVDLRTAKADGRLAAFAAK